ncbi:MAG TPA: hybrid sensor histidine kinase/response regulator, partial [Burkholderiaceae bacterium]|nr:hybrid sensor histidine kinase/response regulator [Burkholderiaceae bacterium]
MAAAGLGAVALLITATASWWLIERQHQQALRELAAREREMHAAAVAHHLQALADRMLEVSASSILASGLVDSAGRETYLVPYLGAIRQVNGIPVQVLFTDFEGQEIASNGIARFTPEQLGWFSKALEGGQRAARIFSAGEDRHELVAFEPLVYFRTRSAEGAVLYKIGIEDMYPSGALHLEWNGRAAGAPNSDGDASSPVAAPAVFESLGFRVRGPNVPSMSSLSLAPQYLTVLAVTLALLGALVLAGMRLARVLTGDLQRLDAFARRLIGSGLPTERAPVTGSAEVAGLAASINEMLDRLNEQHSTLLREREKLTDLTSALQVADRRKDEFIAMLAHELRNPLAPILNGAHLLRAHAGDDPRLASATEIIARQAMHMTKLVDDLLDVSRITRGLITLNRSELSLAAVVSAAIDQTRPLLDQRRHRLTVQLPEEAVAVDGDAIRLIQVLSNLLNNAAKYTPEGGAIRVQVDATPHEARISVTDTGSGIEPELMRDIFEPFVQGTRNVDRAQGGLGLGLALAKTLIELHGGSVEARSDGPGRGATVSFRLPRVTPTTVAPGNRASPADESPALQLRLLIVDDNRDAASSLAQLMRIHGHRVETAYDGPSA